MLQLKHVDDLKVKLTKHLLAAHTSHKLIKMFFCNYVC